MTTSAPADDPLGHEVEALRSALIEAGIVCFATPGDEATLALVKELRVPGLRIVTTHLLPGDPVEPEPPPPQQALPRALQAQARQQAQEALQRAAGDAQRAGTLLGSSDAPASLLEPEKALSVDPPLAAANDDDIPIDRALQRLIDQSGFTLAKIDIGLYRLAAADGTVICCGGLRECERLVRKYTLAMG